MFAHLAAALLSALLSVPGLARVERWVDGDTLHATTAAGDTTVRLPDIDAAEYQHHSGRISSECVDKRLAAEAAARAAQLAPVGTWVVLRGDDTDRYGRRLAAVTSAHSADVGRQLVTEGLARDWPDGACPAHITTSTEGNP